MKRPDQLADDSLQLPTQRSIYTLIFCGVLLWLIYSAVAWLSGRFSYQTPGADRPIVEVLSLLAAAFAVYLIAIRVAILAGTCRELIPIIGIFAISFRLTLISSEPIQEIDIYRYLWDGQATIHGVSPFQYSPQQVLTSSKEQTLPPDLAKLITARDSSPAIQIILKRVHYGELSTVYPPVSQGVFALAALTTSSGASLSTHLVVMKAWIVAFDVATIWLLICILRLTAKPVGWSVAYAWCPLVLKEFANSGHLDSIAVCLTTFTVYLMLRAFYNSGHQSAVTKYSVNRSLKWVIFASVMLGLAVGAKLYPVVLAPLLVLMSVRRLGWSRAAVVAFVFLFVSTSVCGPMLAQHLQDNRLSQDTEEHTRILEPSVPPVSPGAAPPDVALMDKAHKIHHDPEAGLSAFLSRWKMNDFLFLLVNENLTPMQEFPCQQQPWFVVTSENGRQSIVKRFSDLFSVDPQQVPFILARVVTAIIFLVLAGFFCWSALNDDQASRFLEAVFLTLAWFWLLLPTQNPWYWIWAVPFLPFASSRAWLFLSGLTLLYYLRFWLGYHWPNTSVPFSSYSGETFFDYVVVWIEFGPWFLWLAMCAITKKWNPKQ